MLVIGTALIAITGLDIRIESSFYRNGVWIGKDLNPWRFLYRHGVAPAYICAGVALAILAGGYLKANLALYRKRALFVVLLLVIGPGLLVNTVFKDHWGRPRPTQLQIFNGKEMASYHQVWERGESGTGHSFPSGHSSAAFYLMFPYFLLRRRSPAKARLALAGGIGYGLFMGVARMAQGGHFPSDVLWAGGIVYLTGVALYHLLGMDEDAVPVPSGSADLAAGEASAD
nr:phosphatase PAP2 family protein [Geomonas sp. Red32]